MSKQVIASLANKYCKNRVLRFFFRPIWKIYHKSEYKRQVRNFHKNGQDLLEKISSICFKNKIVFWLEFGTLLGAYREKDFIKHDFDIDLGIMFEDKERFQNAIMREGFKLLREFKIIENNIIIGAEQTYSYKSVMVDIFYHHKINSNQVKSYSFTPILNDRAYKGRAEIIERTKPYIGFKEIYFKNVPVFVPLNTSEYLANYYGPGFMTPDPNFNYKNVLNNIIFYDRKDWTAEYDVYERIYL